MEAKVIDALKNDKVLSDNPDDNGDKLTFGQRIADKVAFFGGS